MNLLILGGNSQRNKEWVHEVNSFVKDIFENTIIHEYRHWGTDLDILDFDLELDSITREAAEVGNYGVFAKSVGSLLSLTLISRGSLKPKFCVFAGIALKLAREEGIDTESLFCSISCPVIIIQNDKDPVGGADEVIQLVKGIDNIEVIETRGNDHSYNDFNLIKNKLEKLLEV
ncbi:MAG: hypothetical protein QG623_328 [Patescibacteria group bacterium]|nr:hypothetical protein [Patescibacteria group bacterium]